VSPDVLSVRAASFRYHGSRRAIGPFDLRLTAGEVLLGTGPSGAGKSTLARLCCGVIPHLYRGEMSGDVRVRGRRTSDGFLWQIVEDVGLVGQNPAAQMVGSTVRDEIAFGLSSLRLPAATRARRTEQALDWADLHDRAEDDPRKLSGGEQQRLLLAACAARRPAAIVLDEPLSMLDHVAVDHVVGMLGELRGEGRAALLFEHRTDALEGVASLRRQPLAPERPEIAEAPLPDPPQLPAAFRIETRGLEVRGDGPILCGIDLDLESGQVVALVGANGSGKTTLLRALAGLAESRGRVRINATSGPTPRLGLAFQNPDRQIFNASVRAEILCGIERPDEDRYRTILRALGLADLESVPPLLLSEGEKKRLGIATLLVRDRLGGILLDEPTLGQDAAHRRLIGRLARWLADAGALVVAATHDLSWARTWADRTVTLSHGRVAEAHPAPGEADAALHHRWAETAS